MVDPPRRLAPDGDHQNGGGVRGTAAKTRAGPEGERSENVDPTGVEVGATVDLAPSPEGPERVAGAGVAPEESDPGTALGNEARVVDGSKTWTERVWEGRRWRKAGSPIELMDRSPTREYVEPGAGKQEAKSAPATDRIDPGRRATTNTHAPCKLLRTNRCVSKVVILYNIQNSTLTSTNPDPYPALPFYTK